MRRTGDRTPVRIARGWTITHDAGARLADIIGPDHNVIAAVRVARGGSGPRPNSGYRGTTIPTAEDLIAALVEYARDHDHGCALIALHRRKDTREPLPEWYPRCCRRLNRGARRLRTPLNR